MPHIHYWSPGSATQPTSLGGDDHYFRLGTYISGQEPSDANVGAEGIFFYTSGKYSLKSTDALHAAVDGPVTRTVETGDWTYTNDSANTSITATEGAIAVTAKESIHIASSMTTVGDDETTSITIQAGETGKEHSVYYRQAVYVGTTTELEEKIVDAHAHKTNIGILLNAHAGAGVTNSYTFELSYTTASYSATALEINVTGVAINIENNKNGTAFGVMSFTLYEGKKIALDEEFCGFKNEFKWVRFKNGFTGFGWEALKYRWRNAYDKNDDAIVAEYKKFNMSI